jgi:hypothetical protein
MTNRAITPTRVAAAWHSIQDDWFVRLYKGKARPWQVVRRTAENDGLKVVASFKNEASAHATAERLENMARGQAVLGALRQISPRRK